MHGIKEKFLGWCMLLRLPNLFTVPGDPALGYILFGGKAGETKFVFVIIASLMFYIFGLITNDIADFAEDSLERPHRPLPSGRVQLKTAKFTSVFFALSGLLFTFFSGKSAFVTGLFLLACIAFYNFYLKNMRFAGTFFPSFCRILNLSLGVAASGSGIISSEIIFPAIIFYFVYVYGVSLSAKHEAKIEKKGLITGSCLVFAVSLFWIISGLLICSGLIFLVNEVPPSVIFGTALSLILIFSSGWTALMFRWNSNSRFVQKQTGEFIRNLIIFQASACAFAGFLDSAIYISLLYFPAWALSRYFYES